MITGQDGLQFAQLTIAMRRCGAEVRPACMQQQTQAARMDGHADMPAPVPTSQMHIADPFAHADRSGVYLTL